MNSLKLKVNLKKLKLWLDKLFGYFNNTLLILLVHSIYKNGKF